MQDPGGTWLRWRAVAACTLLAGALAAPSAVWAHCGDYVLLGGAAAHSRREAAETTLSGRQAKAEGEPLRTPPCTGLVCRNAPGLPAPLAPPLAGPTVDHWACVLSAQPARVGACAFAVQPVEPTHPLPCGRRLERPPRA
jgi:hypothetical protein